MLFVSRHRQFAEPCAPLLTDPPAISAIVSDFDGTLSRSCRPRRGPRLSRGAADSCCPAWPEKSVWWQWCRVAPSHSWSTNWCGRSSTGRWTPPTDRGKRPGLSDWSGSTASSGRSEDRRHRPGAGAEHWVLAVDGSLDRLQLTAPPRSGGGAEGSGRHRPLAPSPARPSPGSTEAVAAESERTGLQSPPRADVDRAAAGPRHRQGHRWSGAWSRAVRRPATWVTTSATYLPSPALAELRADRHGHGVGGGGRRRECTRGGGGGRPHPGRSAGGPGVSWAGWPS